MKIAVAMSGGIDSSVAALILKEQGHDVTGITARFLDHGDANDLIFSSSLHDAETVAEHLGIAHHSFDFSTEFSRLVIDPFCSEYLAGRTPNPCIICNHTVKFRLLINAAHELGCEMLATGHYVIKKEAGGRYFLSMAADENRDQSYFLCLLSQEQLSHSMFPLGTFTKAAIRQKAEENNIKIHDKPDSQEICFIPANDYISFIEKRTGVMPAHGRITDSSGKVLGTHNGIHRYTIGQRRGLGISAPEPLYVTGIDCSGNRIIAGYRDELMVEGLVTSDTHDMKYSIETGTRAYIKTRSTQRPVSGTVERNGGRFIVRFDGPMTGISPGQTAVFYDIEHDIIACGKIESSIKHF